MNPLGFGFTSTPMSMPASEILSVDRLSRGQYGQVTELTGSDTLVQRLRELGFYEGATVSVQAKMFFWGPIVLVVDSFSVALRRSEASGLKVRLLQEDI